MSVRMGAVAAVASVLTVVLLPGAAGAGVARPSGSGGSTATNAATTPAAVVQQYYRNPLRRIRNLYAKRIDEGVDYSGSGPVKALGRAIVTVVDRGSSQFWVNQGGNVVVEQLQDGPLAGISVYNSENCTPNPSLHTGDQVTTTTTLCHLHNQFPFMEIGFAKNNTSAVPLAWPIYRTVPDGSKTAYGVDFSRLLGDLGAPRGNTNHGTGDQSYHPHTLIGKLPQRIPRF